MEIMIFFNIVPIIIFIVLAIFGVIHSVAPYLAPIMRISFYLTAVIEIIMLIKNLRKTFSRGKSNRILSFLIGIFSLTACLLFTLIFYYVLYGAFYEAVQLRNLFTLVISFILVLPVGAMMWGATTNLYVKSLETFDESIGKAFGFAVAIIPVNFLWLFAIYQEGAGKFIDSIFAWILFRK